MSALFVFGTLRHAPLRAVVLGAEGAARPARLAGWEVRRAATGHWPVLVPGPGGAEGLLLELDPAAQARADFFELGFGYGLRPVTVETEAGPVAAQAYFAAGPEPSAAAWSLTDWARDWGAVWRAAADEAMALFGQIGAEELARRWHMIELRAATRQRAARSAPTELRSALSVESDVDVILETRPYSNFFTLEERDLRFRRFDGTMSAAVNRAGFVGGDAATVLPWDPALDAVLVVEQFRIGPMLRGDPRPWALEPIAGRIDAGETPEQCARREAMEEAGVTLGALHHVADYYPSPGAATDYFFTFVAEADLAGRGGLIGGVASEEEDIRSHVVPFDRLMQLIASGEAATGPLILSALWLQRHRAGL